MEADKIVANIRRRSAELICEEILIDGCAKVADNNACKEKVKKELYKQKPTAVRTNYQGKYAHYVAQLEDASIIQFEIPNQEATFGNEVPAQLLIRWLV